MLGSWLAYAAASDGEKLPYDLSFWRAGLSAAGTGLTLMLARKRSRAALPAAIATAAVTIALGVVNKRKTGSYVTRTWPADSPKETVFNTWMPVAQAAGSAALAGVGAWSAMRARREGTLAGPASDAYWYPLARKLALYFMGFSIVGHWGEMLFCHGIRLGIFQGDYDRSNHMLWDTWLYPFPAEGTAAVLAELVLMPAKRMLEERAGVAALVPSFLLNQAVCTSIDYGTGMAANRNYELWDYRELPFNFQGQVCLQNSLFYTVVATLGVWALLPALEQAMDGAGDDVLDALLAGGGAAYTLLMALYFCG